MSMLGPSVDLSNHLISCAAGYVDVEAKLLYSVGLSNHYKMFISITFKLLIVTEHR